MEVVFQTMRHAESYPLIAMYGPNDTLSIIEKAAKKHACGLYGTGGFGGKQALVLYTDDVRKFIPLANELLRFIQWIRILLLIILCLKY